jgi:hypothetical protein
VEQQQQSSVQASAGQCGGQQQGSVWGSRRAASRQQQARMFKQQVSGLQWQQDTHVCEWQSGGGMPRVQGYSPAAPGSAMAPQPHRVRLISSHRLVHT